MITVDARFAGGPIVIAPLPSDGIRPDLVEVSLPGLTVALFRHEARALAHALLDGGEITDAGFDRRTAEEVAVTLHPDRDAPAESIAILSTEGAVDQTFDRDGALALAARLIELSKNLPEPPRVLRRRTAVDDEFQVRGL